MSETWDGYDERSGRTEQSTQDTDDPWGQSYKFFPLDDGVDEGEQIKFSDRSGRNTCFPDYVANKEQENGSMELWEVFAEDGKEELWISNGYDSREELAFRLQEDYEDIVE